jgi:hypothetical protein
MTITYEDALNLSKLALARFFSLASNETEPALSDREEGELDAYVMWMLKAHLINPNAQTAQHFAREHLAYAVEHCP